MNSNPLREGIATFLKGAVMGTANVIPGVSGGTFAIIFGILERIVDCIKSFNRNAARLLMQGRFRDFAEHTDIVFLLELAAGMGFAIFSLAKLLEFLFAEYPTLVWAFFFGLILASVYYVAKRISKWTPVTVIMFLAGVTFAGGLCCISQAAPNSSPAYLVLCGMIAISAMILPGLSGSFVLILLGNYELVMIKGVGDFSMEILLPFALGCGAGLLLFSYALSYLMKHFRDLTISLLSGFIVGSLTVIWPWKRPIPQLDALGDVILKDGVPLVCRYDRYIPDAFNGEVILALILAVLGVVLMCFAESLAEAKD